MTTFNTSFQTRMTRLALTMVAAGVIGMSAPALAHHHGERGMERLTEKLELSTEQADAIANLYQAHREQMRSIEWRSADGERNREGWQQAREARQALNEEISAVLNDEQAEQFAAMKQRGNKHGHHGGKRGGRGHGMAFHALDLSDEQRAAMRELMQNKREQGRGNREQMRQQMREILTDEQLAELEASRAERPGKGQRGRRGN